MCFSAGQGCMGWSMHKLRVVMHTWRLAVGASVAGCATTHPTIADCASSTLLPCTPFCTFYSVRCGKQAMHVSMGSIEPHTSQSMAGMVLRLTGLCSSNLAQTPALTTGAAVATVGLTFSKFEAGRTVTGPAAFVSAVACHACNSVGAAATSVAAAIGGLGRL